MMDYPYPTTFLMPLPGNPVKAVCKKIIKSNYNQKSNDDENKKILQSVFEGVSVYFNFTGTAKCLQLSDPDQIGSSMWDYQVRYKM